MDVCPVCGSKINPGEKACDICGTAFDSGPSQCPLCGTEVGDNASQCPSCGSRFDGGLPSEAVQATTSASEEEKDVAAEIAKKVFVDVELEELVKVPGIGPLRAKILYDAGYTDIRKLKQASVVELMNIRGIGRKSAGEIKAALREHTLEEIRGTELTEETVGSERQCQLCGTIVSAFETSCYECGCQFKTDDLDEEDSDRLALSYYDSKLLNSPDNKDLWYARGATLVKMGNYEQALSSFNKALEIDPSFQAAWMSKAEVYNKTGDGAKAAECYSHIITNVSGGLEADDEAGPDLPHEEEDEDLSLEAPQPEPAVEEELIAPEPPPAAEVPIPVEQPEPVQQDANPISEPVAEEPLAEEAGPTIIKPDQSGGVLSVGMDYVKEDAGKPNLDIMSQEDLKKELSARASKVKPYLTLAKDIGVDINHAKRLVSRAVTESKQQEYKIAVMLMDEAIEFAENEFRRRILEDVDNLASVIRDLAAMGKNVSVPAELVKSVRAKLEEGDIEGSVKDLKKCLELVESAAA